MSFKKSILSVFSVNFLSVISGIFVSFIIPIILPIEGYANLKTYTFYVSYILILSLGFADGINYKYAGINESSVNKSILKGEHTVYLISQIAFMAIFIYISLTKKSINMLLISLSIVPINMSWFYKFYYQAIGNFKEYSRVSYIYTIVFFLINVILVVKLKSNNYIHYCLATVISYGLVLLMYEIKFYNKLKNIKTYYNICILDNVRIGIFILIGNLSTMLFYALDRWFIKFLLNFDDFAFYSFAVSMMNVISLLISSLSVTFYNYLSKNKNKETIKELKSYFIILGVISSVGFFVFAGIVSLILDKYSAALSIISILFVAYPYIIVINVLYVNLYKVRKKEKKYVQVVFTMIFISFIYNIIAIILFKNSKSIAVATSLAFITWYIYSAKDFKYLKINLKEILYLCIVGIGFLFISHNLNWLLGGLSYFLLIVITTLIIYKKEVMKLSKIIFKRSY